MQFSTLAEKRKYARLHLRSEIIFSIDSGGKKPGHSAEIFHAFGKNTGAEGVLFSSKTKLTPGTLISLDMLFPGKRSPMRIKGEVKWCSPGGGGWYDTGVRFTKIDKAHLALLVRYVCGNLSKEIVPGEQ